MYNRKDPKKINCHNNFIFNKSVDCSLTVFDIIKEPLKEQFYFSKAVVKWLVRLALYRQVLGSFPVTSCLYYVNQPSSKFWCQRIQKNKI